MKPSWEVEIPAHVGSPVVVAGGLVSILIPCWGQLEYTKLCVRSVLRHSRQPFELLFIDIGSLDGTREYLQGLADASPVRVEVVRTVTDEGITAAIEQALDLAHGAFLVLLNNDTIVTQGWLNQLISLVILEAPFGMVGPMSNYAAPPQLVEDVPYRIGPAKGGQGQSLPEHFLVDTSAVDNFAHSFREQHRTAWMQVDHLGGFCLLFKRELLRKLESTTSLREWTDLRLFDTDLIPLAPPRLRSRRAAHKLARLIYYALRHGITYVRQSQEEYEAKLRERQIASGFSRPLAATGKSKNLPTKGPAVRLNRITPLLVRRLSRKETTP